MRAMTKQMYKDDDLNIEKVAASWFISAKVADSWLNSLKVTTHKWNNFLKRMKCKCTSHKFSY